MLAGHYAAIVVKWQRCAVVRFPDRQNVSPRHIRGVLELSQNSLHITLTGSQS